MRAKKYVRTFALLGISYRVVFSTCSKPNCARCPHGPYVYARYRSAGRRREIYLGTEGSPAVDMLVKIHAEAQKLAAELKPGSEIERRLKAAQVEVLSMALQKHFRFGTRPRRDRYRK